MYRMHQKKRVNRTKDIIIVFLILALGAMAWLAVRNARTLVCDESIVNEQGEMICLYKMGKTNGNR